MMLFLATTYPYCTQILPDTPDTRLANFQMSSKGLFQMFGKTQLFNSLVILKFTTSNQNVRQSLASAIKLNVHSMFDIASRCKLLNQSNSKIAELLGVKQYIMSSIYCLFSQVLWHSTHYTPYILTCIECFILKW